MVYSISRKVSVERQWFDMYESRCPSYVQERRYKCPFWKSSCVMDPRHNTTALFDFKILTAPARHPGWFFLFLFGQQVVLGRVVGIPLILKIWLFYTWSTNLLTFLGCIENWILLSNLNGSSNQISFNFISSEEMLSISPKDIKCSLLKLTLLL